MRRPESMWSLERSHPTLMAAGYALALLLSMAYGLGELRGWWQPRPVRSHTSPSEEPCMFRRLIAAIASWWQRVLAAAQDEALATELLQVELRIAELSAQRTLTPADQLDLMRLGYRRDGLLRMVAHPIGGCEL